MAVGEGDLLMREGFASFRRDGGKDEHKGSKQLILDVIFPGITVHVCTELQTK
jgi:hypothetical protein